MISRKALSRLSLHFRQARNWQMGNMPQRKTRSPQAARRKN
jgi:hypothetical protein